MAKKKESTARRTVTITMDLEVAETLHGLLDGCVGTSDSDDFNAEIIPLRDKLERRIKKHYQKYPPANTPA